MKRNVLIVEDSKESMEALVEIVKECDSTSVIYCADNTAEAYKYAMEERIDLFLVDIVLDNNVANDVSGVVFADKVRQIDRYRFVPLIIVTSLQDYKMSAFENLHCYGYIEKPFDFTKVRTTLSGALKYPIKDERENRQLYYRKEGILYPIDIEKIVYMESVKRSTIVYLENDEIELPYKTCNSILHDLNEDDFLQCSRNIFVNRKYIKYVDEINRYVVLKNGKVVEIGRICKKKFIQELDNNNQLLK